MPEPWPLHWPEGWPRTPAAERRHWPADVGWQDAMKGLRAELTKVGGSAAVISTDCELRRDGLPRASAEPADPGVSVWFVLRRQQRVIACDRFRGLIGNARAITRTLDALRALQRWGTSQIIERAWSGFVAIAPPRPWWDVLGVRPEATIDDIERAFRERARSAHPDVAGGSTAAMQELNAARDEGCKARSEGR